MPISWVRSVTECMTCAKTPAMASARAQKEKTPTRVRLNRGKAKVSSTSESTVVSELTGWSLSIAYEAISPDYFRTMRIPLAAGRDFRADDRAGTTPVAIVSAALARRYWPGQVAPGKRIKLARPDGRQPWLTVVGVAGDVRYREWESARYDIYIPFQQRAQHRSDFVIRTAQAPLTLTGEIDRAV